MSKSNILNSIQQHGCFQVPVCPGVTVETLQNLQWAILLDLTKFNGYESQVKEYLARNNGQDFEFIRSRFGFIKHRHEIEKSRICSLRSMLFPEDIFSNPNHSDTCNQEKINSIRIFLAEYLRFMHYIANLDSKQPYSSPTLMELLFSREENATSQVKVIDLQMEIASERNDKEKYYKLWKDSQSYLEGNQTEYEQDLKAANQKAKSLIFWHGIVGLVYTLFGFLIGRICYRRNQPKRFNTSDSLQERSLDQEEWTVGNESQDNDSDNQSEMSQGSES